MLSRSASLRHPVRFLALTAVASFHPRCISSPPPPPPLSFPRLPSPLFPPSNSAFFQYSKAFSSGSRDDGGDWKLTPEEDEGGFVFPDEGDLAGISEDAPRPSGTEAIITGAGIMDQWEQRPCYPRNLAFSHTKKSNYVDVTMKWKKDPFFDTVDILIRAKELKALISLKNIIANEPTGCIPVSTVSKLDRILEISGRVASFLRKYPAVFEEFTGPQYNHPWFKLTQDAADLDRKERELYAAHQLEIVDRLRRLILMSREKRLPLRIVQGMLWYLGLPEDYLKSSKEIQNGYFQIVRMQDGEQGLSASIGPNEEVISVLQRNAMKLNGNIGSPPSVIKFPLFPSKGLCLKQKIEKWLEEFQKLQYVSPYEDFSTLDPNSDISEKRVIGVLHELLCLFFDNSADRRRLLCLKKHLGLPQKFHKAFERHPHVFYLLLKNKSCFVVLKEAYCANSATAIETHPLFNVRNEYVSLMRKSEDILRSRRGLKVFDKTSHEESFDGLTDFVN